MLYQQGDVLLQLVPGVSTPQEFTDGRTVIPPTKAGHILAEGEATGHSHAIKVEEGVIQFQVGLTRYLSANREFIVVHEEHKPITVPAGLYEVRQVQEYDHFKEEAKVVRD